MNKTRVAQMGVRISVGLAALAGSLMVVCLDEVDYRPYFRQSYYRETAARLHAHVATNSPVIGNLSAGFGRARLTPTINAPEDNPSQGKFRSLPLAGYGDRKGR